MKGSPKLKDHLIEEEEIIISFIYVPKSTLIGAKALGYAAQWK